MARVFSMILVGVGGQGILTISEILGLAALSSGQNILTSEVHGMAQRGGVVTTELKIGEAKSPLIGRGEVDVILGFEPVETYRVLPRAFSSTWVITSVDPLIPPGVSAGLESYPSIESLLSEIRKNCPHLITIRALDLARDAGNPLTGNLVMLGALSSLKIFPISRDALLEAIRKRIPQKHLESNMKAFQMGAEAAESQIGTR